MVLSADPRRLLRELGADYLWKDILQTGLVKTPDLIRRLLQLLAHQAGSEVSVNELATQLQMGRPTVERYLDLLQRTFVIFRLPAFSIQQNTVMIKASRGMAISPGRDVISSLPTDDDSAAPSSLTRTVAHGVPCWSSRPCCSASKIKLAISCKPSRWALWEISE